MNSLSRVLFSHRSLVFKLTIVFLLVILIPMLLLAAISYRVTDSILEDKAYARLSIGLKAAMSEYYARGEQMRYGMLQAATSSELKSAIVRKDTEYLRGRMGEWKRRRPYVNIWSIVDVDGRVLARYNSAKTGDRVELNGLVDKAISTGEALISTEIISEDELVRAGFDITNGLSVANMHGDSVADTAKGVGTHITEAMALSVVTPVLDRAHKSIGAIITIDVLNYDDHVPDTVAYKIPGLFTTISMGRVRISTNMIDSNAQSARGSLMPEEAWSTISSGLTDVYEWKIRGTTILSEFGPIRNNNGEVIGSLDVGIDKDNLWVIQRKNQEVITGTTALGLLLSLLLAVFTANKIARPAKVLAGRIDDFAAGDLSARVNTTNMSGSSDEVMLLAMTFNSMMDTVRTKEEEKARYLREIEANNQKFLNLNEELSTKNEEIELAYEETQSQTEELHSVNEELKLLNEDLDNKNIELMEANTTILNEEQELKLARNKLRLIFDSIKDYLLVVDSDMIIYEANRKFAEDFKVDTLRIEGSNLQAYFGSSCCSHDFKLKESLESMEPVYCEAFMPAGKVYEIHTYPLIDEGGAKKVVLYIKDVTEQRQLLEKLIHADKLTSLGELVSGVAHELNNPLTGIMCFSEILVARKVDDDVMAKAVKIREASERCKKIVDNLLTFARVQPPEKRYADINKVIKHVVDLRLYQLRVDNIEVKLDLDPDLPHNMIDKNQLEQVFLNLLNNARDSILDAATSGLVRVSSKRHGDRMMVIFEDNGVGMSEGVADKMFDPFFTTKGVGKGTGLGLSISYGIIKEHGGEITAASGSGGGAVFTINLPIVEESEQDAESGAVWNGDGADVVNFPKGLRALILDDEPLLLEILDESLNSFGFIVDKCSSVLEALGRLANTEYDLAISDIKMPGLNGMDFHREVSNMYPYLLDRLIFITGDSVNRETQSFLKNTARASLKKPFTIEELGNLAFELLT